MEHLVRWMVTLALAFAAGKVVEKIKMPAI